MDCCAIETEIPAGGKKIAVVGNPNVGKSAIFNSLTGLYVDVSNYSGTTLGMACGRYLSDVIIDTPGVYGLTNSSEEEKITREIILAADMVVNVVNSVHLARDLFFTLQLIDLGIPVVVALNMIDEAEREGLKINIPLLEQQLGVRVFPVNAVSGTGIDALKQGIYFARLGLADPSVIETIKEANRLGSRKEALLLLEGDVELGQRLGQTVGAGREAIYRARRTRANQIAGQVVQAVDRGASFAARLGYWLLQPITGFPILALILWLVYELVGVLLAQIVIDSLGGVMAEYYEPAVRSMLGWLIPPGSVIFTVLAGQYGVLTLTVTYLIGLLLPLVLGIFLVLSVLEDTGYLLRIATLVDRTVSGIGLNGQAVIPLILGFGCVTMACITTRLLGTERERRITTFLLAIGIPCSAQMAIITAVLAGTSGYFMLLYLLFMFVIVVGTGTLLARFLPGRSAPLLIELPPLRLPLVQNVWKKTWNKSYQFIKEAFPLFAGGTLTLGLLDVYGILQKLRDLLAPITVSWLHLPEEVADIFIMGFIRKEFGAAAVLSLQMHPLQEFIVMLTLSLTVPCVAATMVIIKERGWREGLLIWSVVFTMAFIIGGVATRLLEAFSRYDALQVPAVAGVLVLTLIAVIALIKLILPRQAA
ncbi:MAG: Ferrous iron transport protein B [Pelotomaculum sp. PtaB.Bin104]|nr:MAG: Ferrous iron transport protein B [Pelotomaculum sp. PtaB.Bin104]